jgi:penicillin-binding protein 1A
VQVPVGLTQVDGEWLYDEFTGDAARHTLDMDQVPPGAENVAPGADGAVPPPAPVPAPAPASPGAENVTPVPSGAQRPQPAAPPAR